MPKSGHTRDALENLFHERRMKPPISMELDSSELLKRFVAADVRRRVHCPVQCRRGRARRSPLAVIPIADAHIRRDLALVFRKDKALSRAALVFIDTAVKIKALDPSLETVKRGR